MRWSDRELGVEQPDTLPGLARLNNLVRTVTTPEFAGVTFHEILAKSALNKVPGGGKALPFGWTVNPYRGCSHACAYCLDPATLVLAADGSLVPLGTLTPGDEVYGTARRGSYRRYVKTRVSAAWRSRKRAYRVTLADGTRLVTSAEHRFLTERGWKHVLGAEQGADQRPHLTTSNRLQGFGLGAEGSALVPDIDDEDYRRGYLTGMIRGDGMIFEKEYPPRRGGVRRITAFRLALADREALERSADFLEREGVRTTAHIFADEGERTRAISAIHTARQADVQQIRRLTAWPAAASSAWHAGFLAGIFDAEGSCSRGILRISNKDPEIIGRICTALTEIGISHVREGKRPSGVSVVRVTGGLPMRARFFAATATAIRRKRELEGDAVKTVSDLRVMSIEDLGFETDMVDITTGTGDFIANGVIAHNCFARPSHRYLEMNMGTDFDRQIVVKVNVAEVLRRELRRPSWDRHPVALGTNTDPYQRAEGRYRLMPGIIDAFAETGTPFSVLTKGSLLRRDLDRLAEVNETVPVDLAMSIAIYDDELQQSLEPGTPTTKARLATVRAVREHGLDCSVFLMPIMPYLTDSTEQLDDALARVAEAGATSVLYTALHLRPGVKEWFTFWLEREHPELLEPYRELYGDGAYAPKGYRRALAARIRPLLRKHGLEQGVEDPVTGAVRSKALAMMRDANGERRRVPMVRPDGPPRFTADDAADGAAGAPGRAPAPDAPGRDRPAAAAAEMTLF